MGLIDLLLRSGLISAPNPEERKLRKVEEAGAFRRLEQYRKMRGSRKRDLKEAHEKAKKKTSLTVLVDQQRERTAIAAVASATADLAVAKRQSHTHSYTPDE